MPPPDREAPETTQPGDASGRPATRESRQLAEPPSARYGPPPGTPSPGGSGRPLRGALPGPFARAVLVALAGALLLTIVGAIFASTFGLLFAAGLTGASIGLVLARAAVPGEAAAPIARTTIARIAVGLALGAVAIAAIATWIYARSEGGTLDLVAYLVETFGPFVPAEAIIASLAAWWGASTGPVQR